MIRVTVELVPFGVEKNARVLGTMLIINDGTGDTYNGNYNVRKITPRQQRLWRIEGFKRRSKNVWHLIAKALEEY